MKVSFLPGALSAPLFMAEKQGYFKKHGLDVSNIQLATGSATLPAVVKGDIDIAMGGPSAATFRTLGENKGSITVIGGVQRALRWTASDGSELRTDTAFFVRDKAANKINSPASLEGQTVYIPTLGHQSQYYVHQYMAKAGVSDKSVKWGIISTAASGTLAGLQSGRIDVGLLLAPQTSQAVEQKVAKPLFWADDVDPGTNLAMWTASSAFLKKNPQVEKEFIAAMDEANEAYKKAVEAGPNDPAYKKIVDITADTLKTDPKLFTPLPAGETTSINVTDLDNISKYFADMEYYPASDVASHTTYVDCKIVSCVTGTN